MAKRIPNPETREYALMMDAKNHDLMVRLQSVEAKNKELTAKNDELSIMAVKLKKALDEAEGRRIEEVKTLKIAARSALEDLQVYYDHVIDGLLHAGEAAGLNRFNQMFEDDENEEPA